MHLEPLCMQLRPPTSFFLLLGANSSLDKVQHVLISPNSIKIVPNGMFFGPQRDLGCFCASAFAPKPALF